MNKPKFFFLILCIFMLFTSACGTKKVTDASDKSKKPRDNTPSVLMPEAPGTTIYEGEHVSLDISNSKHGYFMVRYTGNTPKVRVQVIGPDQRKNQPLLLVDGNYHAFPFSSGNGTYQINILENTIDTSYAVILSQTVDVVLEDEFQPFLYSNQYVSFNPQSNAIEIASKLSKDAYSDLDVIQEIYHYVIQNITYDEQKATSVKDGYLPSIDDTLSSKTGICFDYAALMSAMMRTQGIPTKLEIGYSRDIKHAWISAYTKEQGWIDNVIEFDGSSWTLMDPTLASNNSKKSVKKYIGDGSNYTLQYSY